MKKFLIILFVLFIPSLLYAADCAQSDKTCAQWESVVDDVIAGEQAIKTGTDPDVDAAGERSQDTDAGDDVPMDESFRAYDKYGNQFVTTMKIKKLYFKISNPANLATWTGRGTSELLWHNHEGFDFYISKIYAATDTDDYSVELYQTESWVNTTNEDDVAYNSGQIATLAMSTDGTNHYRSVMNHVDVNDAGENDNWTSEGSNVYSYVYTDSDNEPLNMFFDTTWGDRKELSGSNDSYSDVLVNDGDWVYCNTSGTPNCTDTNDTIYVYDSGGDPDTEFTYTWVSDFVAKIDSGDMIFLENTSGTTAGNQLIIILFGWLDADVD